MKIQLEEAVRAAYARGLNDRQAGELLGYNPQYVRLLRIQLGIPPNRNRVAQKHSDEELDQIAARLRAGETLQEIAFDFSVTRERIRQLAAKRGACGSDSLKVRRKAAQEIESKVRENLKIKRDLRCTHIYGCDYATLRALNDGKTLSDQTSKVHHYRYWKNNVMRQMRTQCAITFPQWCELWKEHWEERGRGTAYHLARKDRTKPFTLDNVYVEKGDEAMRLHRRFRPWNTVDARNTEA